MLPQSNNQMCMTKVYKKNHKGSFENKGRRMEPTLLKIILISHRFKQLKKQEIKEQSIVPLNFLVFVFLYG